MESYANLVHEYHGQVLVLTLNRPGKLNALNPEMLGELIRSFEELSSPDSETRVVVLRGEGRAFCAGADLVSDAFAEHGPGRAQRQYAMQKLASRVIRLMRSCPQPVIALCQGAVCGGGFSLALAADVRIITPDCRMNAAYVKVGLGGTDMGSGYLLTRLIGHSAASLYLLTGDFITADVAHRTALASEICSNEELLDRGLAMADRMLKVAPLGLRLTKDALNVLVDSPSLEAALALEDRQQVILLETEDHQEGIAALNERRDANYRNQ